MRRMPIVLAALLVVVAAPGTASAHGDESTYSAFGYYVYVPPGGDVVNDGETWHETNGMAGLQRHDHCTPGPNHNRPCAAGETLVPMDSPGLGIGPLGVNGGVAVEGIVRLPYFGSGPGFGTFAGETVGTGVAGPQYASFTYDEPSATCPFTGTASGTLTGAITASFTWTRLGAVAVVSIAGGMNGSAVATFAVTSPAGNPCGATDVTARVVGVGVVN